MCESRYDDYMQWAEEKYYLSGENSFSPEFNRIMSEIDEREEEDNYEKD